MISSIHAGRANGAASTSSGSNDLVDVAIVGGGIVGAAAALGAAQAGLSTTWIAGRAVAPPSSPVDRDLRVYALSPGTQRFLERLRVWSQLDPRRVAPIRDMRIFGGSARLHFGAYEAAVERLATIVEHRELTRVLDTATAFFPGIERVDDVATTVEVGAGHVTVATARGVRRARLVVAADGAQSATREALGIGVTGRSYGQRALVGNFACAQPHGGTAWQWFADDGVIALLPLAADVGTAGAAVSLVWSAPDASADALIAAGGDALAARLSALVADGSAAIGPLTSLGPVIELPLAVQTAQRLIAPRAVLVGDAAHVIHPLAGQGLNLGLGDVEALLDVLAARERFRDCGDVVLLRRYERARAEPVLAMRQLTDGLSRLFDSERRGIAQARVLGLRALDRLAPLADAQAEAQGLAFPILRSVD